MTVLYPADGRVLATTRSARIDPQRPFAVQRVSFGPTPDGVASLGPFVSFHRRVGADIETTWPDSLPPTSNASPWIGDVNGAGTVFGVLKGGLFYSDCGESLVIVDPDDLSFVHVTLDFEVLGSLCLFMRPAPTPDGGVVVAASASDESGARIVSYGSDGGIRWAKSVAYESVKAIAVDDGGQTVVVGYKEPAEATVQVFSTSGELLGTQETSMGDNFVYPAYGNGYVDLVSGRIFGFYTAGPASGIMELATPVPLGDSYAAVVRRQVARWQDNPEPIEPPSEPSSGPPTGPATDQVLRLYRAVFGRALTRQGSPTGRGCTERERPSPRSLRPWLGRTSSRIVSGRSRPIPISSLGCM